MANKRIFPSDSLLGNDSLPAWRQTPATRTEGLVENSTVLDFGKVDDSICHGPQIPQLVTLSVDNLALAGVA